MSEGEGDEDNLLLRRNLFLVCGENEERCERLSVALVFAVQKDPWRLEVDLAGSFVNVGAEFVLEGMRREWLE